MRKDADMKHFMIRYRFTTGSPDDWHREIGRFIAAIDADPALKGKITYRAMKRRDGNDYYHLAATTDDHASKALQQRDFFAPYTEATRRVAGGEVEVIPLEIVAETAQPA